MKKIILLILLSALVYSSPRNVENRFVGIVSDVKIISVDDQENVIFWVKADREYLIQGKAHIPYIYTGDSLYEYWINYRKAGIGTSSDNIIYEILK